MFSLQKSVRPIKTYNPKFLEPSTKEQHPLPSTKLSPGSFESDQGPEFKIVDSSHFLQFIGYFTERNDPYKVLLCYYA